jgi:hypothetical protein
MDDIEELQEPTRTQEVPKDVKDRTWTTLTFQESQREAMAMQTLSSHTLSDSKRLTQQLAQTTLATTTTLSGVRGRGTTQPVPQGGGSGGNPRSNPGGGNPGRGNPGGNPGGGNPGRGNPGGNPGGGNPGRGGGGNPPPEEDNPRDNKQFPPPTENDLWVLLPSTLKVTAPERKNLLTKSQTTSSSTTNTSPSNRPSPE